MSPCRPFVQVEVKKAEPRDSKAPGQLGPGQWVPRGILSAANGWTTQPAQGWQQPYGPQGEWEHLWRTFRDALTEFCEHITSSNLINLLFFSPSRSVGVDYGPAHRCVSSWSQKIYILSSFTLKAVACFPALRMTELVNYSECVGSSLSLKAWTCTRWRSSVGWRRLAAHVITDS